VTGHATVSTNLTTSEDPITILREHLTLDDWNATDQKCNGPLPERFFWQWIDKDGDFHRDVELTPVEFASRPGQFHER
jgi:hypothetical protein